MPKLSENYFLRKYYLETNQVPTQTTMKERMSAPLAHVYFKSMPPKLKILAGLEPPMKGGGSDWYMPPDDLLKGRAVMKPLKKKFLSQLGFDGIDYFGQRILENHQKEMEDEKVRFILENDNNWKISIEKNCRQKFEEASKEHARQNTTKIQNAFQEFTTLYMTSITRIEQMIMEASAKQIRCGQEETFNKMSSKLETLVKHQATMLYDEYTEKLMNKKAKLKEDFINQVECSRTMMGEKLHDINVEKHLAIEKLRIVLECQNLACQVYVSLKEREECEKEIAMTTHKHKKKIKELKEELQMQEFEIRLAKEKEKKRQEFIKIWQKKVCHVVKKFQVFVKYCLSTLPDHADFFINMEKLMLLQLSEVLDNPSAESIFVSEEDQPKTPVAKPHPFFLFCDKGYKPKIDEKLCPKHCTSSASQFPVIVVNKRCIYSACNNFETFTDTLKQLLDDHGSDKDFIDDHDYTFDVPIKVTSSEQLLQLKLESSLMQILQEEIPNPKNIDIGCCVCKVKTCYCDSPDSKEFVPKIKESKEIKPEKPVDLGNVIESRTTILDHQREPKLDSYLDFVLPNCKCAKKAKKHLQEHLPAYMRKMSNYDAINLPNYETCSIEKLRHLVKQARGWKPSAEPIKIESKTKNACTQYSDQQFELLCTCFSEEEVQKLFKHLIKGSKLYGESAEPRLEVITGSLTSMSIKKDPSTFVKERAYSLRRMIDESPELKELFINEDCNFK